MVSPHRERYLTKLAERDRQIDRLLRDLYNCREECRLAHARYARDVQQSGELIIQIQDILYVMGALPWDVRWRVDELLAARAKAGQGWPIRMCETPDVTYGL